MKHIFFLGILFFLYSCSTVSSEPAPSDSTDYGIQLRIMSWNIQNFGFKKSNDEELMNYIAEVIESYDIVAIQEISTSIQGAKAIAALDDFMDRRGCEWDYILSDPTEGEGSERYCYLFKPNKVKLKKHYLEPTLKGIDREPFVGVFEFKGNNYYLMNVHLVPKKKHPEIEAEMLCEIRRYEGKSILLGDFNLSEEHKSFNCVKETHSAVLVGEKTTLKMKETDEGALSNPYDNFFISSEVNLVSKGVVHFYRDFPDLKAARKISDHCPIFITVK